VDRDDLDVLSLVPSDGTIGSSTTTGHSFRIESLGLAAAIIVTPLLYLIFVLHYSVNVPAQDDWTVVPLIHAALHGQLSFSGLWRLHDENRMLFPNLVFVGLGVLSRDDINVLTGVSAAIFVATFFVFLVLFRSYRGRPLTPLVVLVLGAVWFSLEAWYNALWGFQLAWYLILFCLMALLYLLLERTSRLAYALGLAAAVVASFSFLWGLVLWPVGALCIAWVLPGGPRLWIRSKRLLLWAAAMVVTAVATLWGYNFKPLGCLVGGKFQFSCSGSTLTFALHHPAQTAEYVLLELGNVLPNSNGNIVWLTGVLGAVLFTMAVAVVIASVRNRHHDHNCLPVALIVFGLLFDLLTAIARVEFLTGGSTGGATTSTYTMPNLLILLGLISYAWDRFGSNRISRPLTRVAVRSMAAAFLVAQLALSTHTGIAQARAWDQLQTSNARLIVNLNEVPAQERLCYDVIGVDIDLLFTPNSVGYVGFTEDRQDQLNVFSPGLLQTYRRDGLPDIPQCRKG
jgi:hypothetical protein